MWDENLAILYLHCCILRGRSSSCKSKLTLINKIDVLVQDRRAGYHIGSNPEHPEIPISATCREKCTFEMIEVEKAEDYIIDDERLCTFIDDDECRATFVYGYHNATGRLQVWVQTTKECPVVVDIMGE